MKPYVVRQGDYLAKIAFRLGVSESDIWVDAKNEELKKLRRDPNVLCPGDLLYVPDVSAEPQALQAETSNTYTGDVPKVKVTVNITDEDGEPISGKKYWVYGLAPEGEDDEDAGGEEAQPPTTGGNGEIELEVPITTTEVVVVLEDDPVVRRLKIGHLDPACESTGTRARLVHLGYCPDESAFAEAAELDVSALADLAEARDALALAAFQADNKLDDTGELDDKTIEALEKEHGA